jgi:hypothetical protein
MPAYDRERVGRLRDSRKRSFRPPSGRTTVRWRWEVGLPLMVIGALMAYTVIGASGAQVIFWAGVALAAIGATVFFKR